MIKSSKIFATKAFYLFVFLSLFINTEVIAQAPGALFRLQSTVNGASGGQYPSLTYVDSASWTTSLTGSAGSISSSLTQTGSVSSSSGNASISSTYSGTSSGSIIGTGVSGAQLSSSLATNIYVKGGATAFISVGYNSSASGSVSAGSGQASSSISQLSWITGTPASVAVATTTTPSATSTGSQSGSLTNYGSCSPTLVYPPAYPTTGYRVINHPVSTLTIGTQGSITPGSNFNGTLSASSSSSFITVTLGSDDPISIINGPLVGGSTATGTIDAGTAVTFTTSSYDPDDSGGGPANICSRLWTLTDPSGTVTTSTASSFPSTTLSKAGPYTMSLSVTDNEGAQSSSTITFTVGGKRKCIPGGNKFKPQACSDEKTSIELDLYCGEGGVISHDPTATRGYPLRNEIKINSTPFTVFDKQWMGNSAFTYGIQVVAVSSGGGGGISNPTRYLVDGYGAVYDYGLSTSGSNPKTKGVFPTLTETTSGYLLENAGAPDEVYKSGNFTYEFDTTGRLLTLTDSNSNTQDITYDTGGNPTLVTDSSSGRTVSFSYGTNGKISRVTENGGFAYRDITYDTSYRVTSIVTKNASNVTIRTIDVTYDTNGRIATVQRDGNTSSTATFSYQDGGEGVSVANVSSAIGGATNVNYFQTVANGAKFRSRVTNAKGGTVDYDFDADGNLIAIREPTYNGATSGAVTTFTYDTNRNMLTQSDGASTVTYTYNTLGLTTQRQDSLGRYVNYTYSGNNLTRIEDNLGTVAEFLYANTSLPNAITGFKDGSTNQWTIGRNAYGQVTSIIPPTGSPTGTLSFTYEETTTNPNFGYLKTVTNGAGDVATVNSYTALGDPTSITTNPASGVTRTVQMSYDAVQRETVYTHGDGKTVQTAYTGPNATSVTDEAGTLTQYSYCADCGKLTGVSGPLSWALSWVLDNDRDVTSFTDALSKTTTYTYGTARELKQTTYPDSTTLKYQYDNFGRFKKFTNGRNVTSTLTFDASGKVTNDGFFTYTYDNAGQLLTAYDSFGKVTYTYTTNRLVASEAYDFSGSTLTNIQTVEYTYNPDQTVATITWKNGTTTVASWTYSYDAAGRVSSIANSFSETTSFSYDGEGKLLTQSNQNGTSRNYTYNNQRGWPTQIKYKAGSTTTSQFDLTYDSSANTVGNITGITELSGATVSYGYDDLYRLTSETRSATPSYSRTYGYDLNGNPTTINGSSFATFDNANKFSIVLTKTVTQDNDGNITAIATSPFTFTGATWDNRSKMTRGNISGGNYTDYRYLYDGKRFYSKASSGTTSRIYYIFAGDTLIGEITTSTPTAAYTWGADGLISRRNLSSSTSSWYEFGPQGETRTLTNSSGASTDTYNYNGYGVMIASSGSTTNPYKYGGKYGYYTESFTGLVLATQRWYSPDLMRWISRDPIGYEGGVNLYEYVNNRPVYAIDPDGQQAVATGVGGIAAGGAVLIYCAISPEGCTKALENFSNQSNFSNKTKNNFSCDTDFENWDKKGCPPPSHFNRESAERLRYCQDGLSLMDSSRCMVAFFKWVNRCKM